MDIGGQQRASGKNRTTRPIVAVLRRFVSSTSCGNASWGIARSSVVFSGASVLGEGDSEVALGKNRTVTQGSRITHTRDVTRPSVMVLCNLASSLQLHSFNHPHNA